MSFIKRFVAFVGAAAVGLAFTALPANAVIGGTYDSSNKYSNVGKIYVDGDFWCTGTLYRTSTTQKTSNLVLTAGHCVAGVTGQFTVSFEPNPGADSVYYTGVGYLDPGYTGSFKSNSLGADAGVIVLDSAVKGITPADLPSVGLVDTLNPKKTVLTVVGYGINDFSNANTFTYGTRNYKDVSILEGQGTAGRFKYVKTTAASCFGDSGGPNFVKGTNIIIGVVSGGNSYVCRDKSFVYRIDSAETLNFLRNPTTVGVLQG